MRIIIAVIMMLSASFTAQAQCTGTTISVFDITTDSATISWPAPGAVAGYEYEVLPSSSPQPVTGTPITTLSIRVGGLLSGQAYKAWHRTYCGGGQYSTWTSLSFSAAPCGIPSTINITNVRGDSADIAWTEVNPGANYQYAVDTFSTTPSAGIAINANSTRIKGLKAGKTYYVFVRTVCGSVYSAWSSSNFFTNWTTNISQTNIQSSVYVYPNPVSDYLYVHMAAPAGNILIRDTKGTILKYAEAHKHSTAIDVSMLPAGYYIVSLTTADDVKHFKILKH
ncbi:hypothetical protein CAP35_06135 [Chitinophagaceae bacterium IBVUCB1]|nr:hypothetical protein CAP35_06135 [Chitinophagaceae bacterium IBVUCB1]